MATITCGFGPCTLDSATAQLKAGKKKATLTPTKVLQSLTTAYCINRYCSEQFTQLARATTIKSTVSAPRQSGDLSKTPCRIRLITFLKDKGRNAQQT